MSKQRKKGTAYETHLLTPLRRIWPKIKRAGTTLGMGDQGDYLNCGDYLIEAKHHATPHLMPWARTLQSKAGPGRPWIVFSRTDARSFPDLAVMPAWLAFTLLEAVKEKLA